MMNPTMNDSKNGSASARSLPDPQVVEKKAQRRRFSQEYKVRILEEADRCSQPGELGALLRREGLYWSNLQKWRKQRGAGNFEGLRGKRRGRKPNSVEQLRGRLQDLQRRNEQLERRLQRAEKVIEVQKKISELLGVDLGSEVL